MALKLILNVLYTVGIVLCLFTIYWGVTNSHYEFAMGALFIGVIFVVLKLRLLKQVRGMQNNLKK